MSTVAETEAVGTLSFHAALSMAEAQARSTLDVALHERLSAAVALVKTGRTFQASDGTWQVESTSEAGRVYSVNGVCNCEDHHYNHPPQGLCKHRLAMFLSQRVLTLMRQPPVPVVPEMVEPWPDNDAEDAPAPAVETAPTPASPAVLPEAMFSLTLKGTLGGVEALAHRPGPDGRGIQAQPGGHSRAARPGAGACQPPGPGRDAAVRGAWGEEAEQEGKRLVLSAQVGRWHLVQRLNYHGSPERLPSKETCVCNTHFGPRSCSSLAPRLSWSWSRPGPRASAPPPTETRLPPPATPCMRLTPP